VIEVDDDFEQRLRTLLLTDPDPPQNDRFDALVRARISGLRRARTFALLAAAVAATVVVAFLVAPLLATGASFAAESPLALKAGLDALNSGVGALVASPADYVLGALIVVAAIIDTVRR
jgi:hypothetical protein